MISSKFVQFPGYGETRCGHPSVPLRGEKDVFMAYSKNSKWHLSVVVKVDFKVMCFVTEIER